MKLSSILILAMPVLIFSACQNHPPAPASPGSVDTAARRTYFPVRDFLAAEIAATDSIPYKLVKYQTRNGKVDSTLINTQQFNQLAAAFLTDDLDSARFASRFHENAFLDQTTNLLNFTYSTNDTLYGLRRVDVLAEPDPINDRVRSIYMELSSGSKDSLVLRKMYWRSGKSFSILQIDQSMPGQTVSTETRVVWDSNE